ncbi:hypothetical protein BASA81_007894 [Batrachochytrium salamandrivorans]|nr:hypothetical protein BASA81_007894 [Batrachochytrium salamandrivorans]
MYYLSDTSGGAVQLYFIVQVVFGGYFMLQVLVAVLSVNISLERHEAANAHRLGEENPYKAAYRSFCEEKEISLVSEMQMRIVYSYEQAGPSKVVLEEKYGEYLKLHHAVYPEWRALLVPVLHVKETPQPETTTPSNSRGRWLQSTCACMTRFQHMRLAGERPQAWLVTKILCKIAKSKVFSLYIMNSIILLNLATLAVVHYNQPEWMFEFQNTCDLVFFGLFGMEMIIKLWGFGLLQYWTNPALAFEGLITLLGLLQFASDANFAQALRVLRLLRIFPLLFKLKGMQRMVKALGLAMSTALPFVLLMMLFIIIFATLGLHLFGGKLFQLEDCSPSYPTFPDHCPPRLNFDTMQSSLLTTFVLLIAENWNLVMLDVVAATSLWSFIYFAVVLVIGSWVVLNVFLGVLIDSFLQVREQEVQHSAAITGNERDEDSNSNRETLSDGEKRKALSFLLKRKLNRREEARRIDLDAEEGKATLALQEHVEEQRTLRMQRDNMWTFSAHPSFPYPSRWLFGGKNTTVRLCLGAIVVSRSFRVVAISVIVASCVCVAFGSALPVEVTYLFFAWFALEFTLKVCAFGLVGHPGAYLYSKWNVLDLVLLVLNLVTVVLFVVQDTQGMQGRILQATRSLSVLRIVRYVSGIQVTLNSLANSFCPLIELSLVVVCCFVAWGVLATFVFQGMFYACVDNDSGERIPQDDLCMSNALYGFVCPANQTCPGMWENPRYGAPGTEYSFDNLGQSLLVLFEMSTDEDWFMPMFAAMDSTMRLGYNAVREVSYSSSLFFCAVIIFFNLFLMQVFAAVLVDEFRQSGRVADSRAFLTPRQAEWVKIKPAALKLGAKHFYPPETTLAGRTRYPHLLAVTTSRWFKYACLLVVAFNTCVLLSLHYDPSPAYLEFFRVVDWIVGSVYCIELGLDVVTLGWRECFQLRWLPRLSLLVCLTTIVGWAVPDFFPTAQLFDSFQAARLVVAVPQTKRLLSTLWLSAPQVFNVVMLLCLVLYIYSVVGVAVFTSMESSSAELEHINRYANFDAFENAVVTLFRMSCGEGWNSLMREMSVAANWFAYPFCLSFIILVQFLLMNLVVAVVMFDLEDEVETGEEMAGLKTSHLVAYSATWAALRVRVEQENLVALMNELKHPHAGEAKVELDTVRGNGEEDEALLLPAELVFDLLDALPDPLRVSKTHTYKSQVLRQLRIPVNTKGEIHFHTTLNVLVDQIVLCDAVHFRDSNVRPPSSAHFAELRNLVDLKLDPQVLLAEDDVYHKMQREDGLDAAQLLALKTVQRAIRQHLNKKSPSPSSPSESSHHFGSFRALALL